MSRFVSVDVLRDDYARTMDYYKTLADIRFKLLALVPAVTILASGLLGKNSTGAGPIEVAGVGALGLMATLGVVIYEIRNSQLHDAAIHRLKFLEQLLEVPSAAGVGSGLFSERPRRPATIAGIRLWHDRALGIVYGTSIAGWTWLLIGAIGRDAASGPTFWLQLALPVVLGALVLAEVTRLSAVGRPAGRILVLRELPAPQRDAIDPLTALLCSVAASGRTVERSCPSDSSALECAVDLGLVDRYRTRVRRQAHLRLTPRGSRFLGAATTEGRQQVLDEAVVLLREVREADGDLGGKRRTYRDSDATARSALLHETLARDAGCPRWLTREQVERRLRLVEDPRPARACATAPPAPAPDGVAV